jgi:hypothetical protein
VRWLLRQGALLMAASCSPAGKCTEEAEFGLTIHVVDSSNQEPICDAAVVAKDGSYSETLVHPGGSQCQYAGAIERSGTYRIKASREGYLPNSLDAVAVTKECHVNPQSAYDIALEPGRPGVRQATCSDAAAPEGPGAHREMRFQRQARTVRGC